MHSRPGCHPSDDHHFDAVEGLIPTKRGHSLLLIVDAVTCRRGIARKKQKDMKSISFDSFISQCGRVGPAALVQASAGECRAVLCRSRAASAAVVAGIDSQRPGCAECKRRRKTASPATANAAQTALKPSSNFVKPSITSFSWL
jgi:hypothetical protein